MSADSLNSKPDSVFSDLTQKELDFLFSISKEKRLEAGEYLMKEGDKSSEAYIVVEGTLEVIKIDSASLQSFVINTLKEKDSVGELALLDQDVRSASVRAVTPSILREIDASALKKKLKEDPSFFYIYERLARNVTKKLRSTTEKIVDALQHKVIMGQFLIVIIVFMSLMLTALKPLSFILAQASSSTHVSIPMITIFTIGLALFIRFSKIPAKTFGLTLINWKKSLYDGIIYSILALPLFTILKWLVIQFIPGFSEDKLFDPYGFITEPENHTLSYWLIANGLYLVFVPAQELMARGALQGPFEQFLSMKNKVWISIILSNLVFSTAHIFISYTFALASMFVGFFVGWLYSRTHNLIGPIIFHLIVGLWMTSVLGPFKGH